MSAPENFAVFILSHGRADRVSTYYSLRKCGYTGPIWILVDNEDEQAERYEANYPGAVIVFDKAEAAKITDAADNSGKRNSVVFARNINWQIAREKGLTHFWQLDDDYQSFGWTVDNRGRYCSSDPFTGRLDDILKACLRFLDDSSASSVAFVQGGDLVGGAESSFVYKAARGGISRKVMNTFLFRVDRPVPFLGRMNDDVNMFIVNGNRGNLFVTIPRLRVWQKQTQSSEGGLTEMYRESGTYAKSFYTVMYAPHCVSINAIGTKHKRLHHKIRWNGAVPKIISEDYKK